MVSSCGRGFDSLQLHLHIQKISIFKENLPQIINNGGGLVFFVSTNYSQPLTIIPFLMSSLTSRVSTNFYTKKSADQPYSDTGLAQPLQSYGGICTLWVQLQRIVGFALHTLVRGRSSCQRFEQSKSRVSNGTRCKDTK